uniref:glycoside hydrolase family 19 protein n=1 Tax=Pseudomonas sp. Z18(2022) TaxID=2983410 RepID=UPI002E803218
NLLYRNRDGKITADELQAAINLPAHAQTISQLIVHSESEWHRPQRWDILDEILGHSGSTPHLNWLAEKERIKELSWWGEVAERVGLPTYGKVYHFHPVALPSQFMSCSEGVLICHKCRTKINLTEEFVKKICGGGVKASFIKAMVDASGGMFEKYGINSCSQVTHLLAQAKVETGGFVDFRESLNYSRKTYTAKKLYRLSPSVINAGFSRRGMAFLDEERKLKWIEENLIANDAAYGMHCYGSDEQPGKDFRGRGLIHLTHYETYKKCALETGLAVDSNPDLLERDYSIAIETALWFWRWRGIAAIADNGHLSSDSAVTAVTRPINAGLAGLSERKQHKRDITSIFYHNFKSGCSEYD